MRKKFIYIISAVFLFSAVAFAADKQGSGSAAGASKAAQSRVAKMNAMGKVIVISDKSIKIERTVKDKVEAMEFALENPTPGIAVNDKVKIAYLEKEGTLLAVRVAKITPKKEQKKEIIAEKGALPGK